MKRLSVRERSMKSLIETVTYIAIKEGVTCIISIGMVMCIIHCRDSHLRKSNKNCHPHICCITATETAACITVTERFTNMTITESTTSKPAKMQQTSSLA